MKKFIKNLFKEYQREFLKHIPEYLKGYKQNKDKFIQRKANRIIVVGEPENGNAGDQAIALAQYEFLKKNFSDKYDIITIRLIDFWCYFRCIVKCSSKDDVIMIQGGGNMGDVYAAAEYMRHLLIKFLPKNRIVIFPQTFSYTDTAFGNKLKRETKSIYCKHKNLTICAREQYSYEMMKLFFTENKVLLIPDMVLWLDVEEIPKCERDKILICLRDDCEGVLSGAQKEKINELCKKSNLEVIKTDTFAPNVVISNLEERKRIVKDKIDEFAGAKLVITDRLHGMVFAMYAHTPCLVFSNNNHKVKGVYQWIKMVGNIEFCEQFVDLEKMVEKLLRTEAENDQYNIPKEYENQLIEAVEGTVVEKK